MTATTGDAAVYLPPDRWPQRHDCWIGTLERRLRFEIMGLNVGAAEARDALRRACDRADHQAARFARVWLRHVQCRRHLARAGFLAEERRAAATTVE